MAEKRRVIRLEGPRYARVRYGRATLTIARCGILSMGDLGKSIHAYQREELSAEEVCAAFVRRRVREHSPSFDWETADPQRLLRLVAEASEEPKFAATDAGSVADELARAADAELKQLKEALQGIAVPVIKKLSDLFDSKKYSPIGKLQADAAAKAKLFDLTGSSRLLQQMKASLPDLSKSGFAGGSVRNQHLKQIGEITRANAQIPKLTDLGITSKVLDPDWFKAAGWMRTLPDPAPFLRRLQEATAGIVEQFKAALPANWRELEPEEVEQAVELMKTEGWGLAWVPREEILRLLLAAVTHEERCAVLIEHREQIIEDVEQALGKVEREDMLYLAGAGEKAIAGYRDGYPELAQTYAAAAIGEVIHGPLGWEGFTEVRQAFKDKDPMHGVQYAYFPFFAMGHALMRVLDRFEKAGAGFNRALTVHRIGSPHTEANLLMVLMLFAGLVLEVEWLLNRHDVDQLDEEAV